MLATINGKSLGHLTRHISGAWPNTVDIQASEDQLTATVNADSLCVTTLAPADIGRQGGVRLPTASIKKLASQLQREQMLILSSDSQSYLRVESDRANIEAVAAATNAVSVTVNEQGASVDSCQLKTALKRITKLCSQSKCNRKEASITVSLTTGKLVLSTNGVTATLPMSGRRMALNAFSLSIREAQIVEKLAMIDTVEIVQVDQCLFIRGNDFVARLSRLSEPDRAVRSKIKPVAHVEAAQLSRAIKQLILFGDVARCTVNARTLKLAIQRQACVAIDANGVSRQTVSLNLPKLRTVLDRAKGNVSIGVDSVEVDGLVVSMES